MLGRVAFHAPDQGRGALVQFLVYGFVFKSLTFLNLSLVVVTHQTSVVGGGSSLWRTGRAAVDFW